MPKKKKVKISETKLTELLEKLREELFLIDKKKNPKDFWKLYIKR